MRKVTVITEHPDGRTIMYIYEIPDHLYPEVYENAISSSRLYAAASKVTQFEGRVVKLRDPDIPGPRQPEPPDIKYVAEASCGHPRWKMDVDLCREPCCPKFHEAN